MSAKRCSNCISFADDIGVCLDIAKVIYDFTNDIYNRNTEPVTVHKNNWCANHQLIENITEPGELL